jgi:hypothetical protein
MVRKAIPVLQAVPLFLLWGCAQLPTIEVAPAIESQQVVFDISHKDINGLLGFRVEDESGKPLWVVHMNYDTGHRIIYGVLPTDIPTTRQEFPPEGRPPVSIRGKKVKITVEYQYDSNLTACMGSCTKTVQIPE